MINEEILLSRSEAVLDSAKNALTNFPELDQKVIELIQAQRNIVESYLIEWNESTGMLEKYAAASKAYASAGSLNLTLAYLVW